LSEVVRVIPFERLRMTDVEEVGGKNASLGEMLSQLTAAGLRVPDGFATTAEAFRLFLDEGGLRQRIQARLFLRLGGGGGGGRIRHDLVACCLVVHPGV